MKSWKKHVFKRSSWLPNKQIKPFFFHFQTRPCNGAEAIEAEKLLTSKIYWLEDWTYFADGVSKNENTRAVALGRVPRDITHISKSSYAKLEPPTYESTIASYQLRQESGVAAEPGQCWAQSIGSIRSPLLFIRNRCRTKYETSPWTYDSHKKLKLLLFENIPLLYIFVH